MMFVVLFYLGERVMVRKEHYVTYTDKELQSIQTVGESQSN